MVSIDDIVSKAHGLVRFTYRADAGAYFRATSKVAGGPRFDVRFPRGLVKISDVVANVNLDQSYERELMAAALRQSIPTEKVTTLVTLAANGLNGMTWHPSHVGLIALNGDGRHALRAYPASGLDNYGSSKATYLDVATGLNVAEAELDQWRGAPKKRYPLVIDGVTMCRADGTPIYKVTPHYYFLDSMEDLRPV